MADWEFHADYGAVDVTIGLSWREVVGAPVVSISAVAFGSAGALPAMAGVYRFKHVTQTTVSVRIVNSQDALNPDVYAGTRAVVADGVTSNLNLLAGYSVVISSSAAADNEWEIGVGCYWDSTNGRWVRYTPVGQKQAGFYDSEKTYTIKNATGLVQTDSYLVATNLIRLVNGQTPSRPFYSFRQTGILNPTAHEDTDGIPITFDNYAGGSPPTVDILVDGAAIDIYDVTNEVSIPGGVGLECDGTTVYRFADATDYQSGEFILSSALAETDTATIYVSDGGEWVQIATETGDFVAGPTGIDLTGADEIEGQVAIDEEVIFKIKFGGPSDADIDLNMRGFSLRVTSTGV